MKIIGTTTEASNPHYEKTLTNHSVNDPLAYIEEKIAKNIRTKLERVRHEGKFYPEITILDRTRNIYGYIVIRELKEEKEHSNNKEKYLERLLKEIRIAYSELDRPVYYVYWFYSATGELILKFQTSEQIHDVLIKRLENNLTTPFVPQDSEMGEFDEMIMQINSNL